MWSLRFTPGQNKGGQLSPNTVGLNAGCFGLCFQWDKEAIQSFCSTFEQKRKLMQCCGPFLSLVIGGIHYGPTFTGQCFNRAGQEGAQTIQSLYKGIFVSVIYWFNWYACCWPADVVFVWGDIWVVVTWRWIWIYFTLIAHNYSSNWNIFFTETLRHPWSVKCESVLGRRWSHFTGTLYN